MKVTWITILLAASSTGRAMAQGVSKYVPVSAACLELKRTVMKLKSQMESSRRVNSRCQRS